jgi:hypothetical protein
MAKSTLTQGDSNRGAPTIKAPTPTPRPTHLPAAQSNTDKKS